MTWLISTELLFQANSNASSTIEPTKPELIIEFLSQNPVIGWSIAGFTVLALATAAISNWTGNLDKIVEFIRKYFTPGKAYLPDEQLAKLRSQLLQIMQASVSQRLADSLHNLVRIDLHREEQRQRVGRPTLALVEEDRKPVQLPRDLINRLFKLFKRPAAVTPISSSKQTYEIFKRNDIQGRLLILGEPGSGKTTELLTLAERLIKQAIESTDNPIPVIFELSTWQPGMPISVWIGAQLREKYRISESVTKRLIQGCYLLPLLDGLDELGLQHQISCIAAIDKFLIEHPILPLVVCCRREEYEQGEGQIERLNGAIYLLPVRPEQIFDYLRELNRASLWRKIQAEPELLFLAQSPLFLTMLIVAYQGQPIESTEQLFNAYIQKQLQNLDNQGVYPPGKGPCLGKTQHDIDFSTRCLFS